MPVPVFLGGPVVTNPQGTVFQIINAKEVGAQGMHWSFVDKGGWFLPDRKYTNTLRVFTTSPLVGPIQVQQAVLGIGAVQGAYYRFPLPELVGGAISLTTPTEQDTGSFCQSMEIAQDAEDSRQWKVVLQYSSYDIFHELGGSNVQNGSINPIEMAPEVHWSSAKFEVSNVLDINGIPFINTAGDPLENPPKTEETRQVLLFTRNESDYQEQWAQQFRDSVNGTVFLGYQPNQVKCKDIQGKRIYSTDYGYYWQVSYEFEFRIGYTTMVTAAEGDVDTIGEGFFNPSTTTTGWYAVVLNAGLRQLVGGTGSPKQITIDGSLVTAPVPLQQNGAYVPLTTAGTDPFYLQFVLYPAQDFSLLNIPNNVLTQTQ